MHVQYSLSYNSQIKCFQTLDVMDFFLVSVCGTCTQSLSAPFGYTMYIVMSDPKKLHHYNIKTLKN
jgi:hypothetical protein